MQFNRDLYNQWEERRSTGLETGEETRGDEADDDEDDDPLADLNSYLKDEREAPYHVFGANQLGDPYHGVPNFSDIWPLDDQFVHNVGDFDEEDPDFPTIGTPENRCSSDLICNPVFIRIIGEGSYGEVWEVDADYDLFVGTGWEQTDGKRARVWENRKFAVKVMHHKRLSQMNISLTEIGILRYLRHENICNYADFIGIKDEETDFPYPIICIFFELCDGTLEEIVAQSDPQNYGFMQMAVLQEYLNRHWFAQVANGLEYLHRNRIAHNDIKMDNILYKSEKDPNYAYEDKFMSSVFKLTDFGLSSLSNNILDYSQDLHRLFRMLAILGGVGEQSLSASFDMFNVFVDYCRGIPVDQYQCPDQWKELSLEFKDLVSRMSIFNPFSPVPAIGAITASQILEHKWLQMNKDPRTEPFIYRKPREKWDSWKCTIGRSF